MAVPSFIHLNRKFLDQVTIVSTLNVSIIALTRMVFVTQVLVFVSVVKFLIHTTKARYGRIGRVKIAHT